MNNQQAINLLKGLEQSLDDYCELNDEGKTAFGMAITALELFGNSERLPSAQPPMIDEWCDDCKEYDSEKHCCPRWNRVIRQTAEDMKAAQPHWIPVTERLPEYRTQALTIHKDGDYEINHVIDEEDGEWFLDGVIAWMPLPEPYKEGHDEQID
jgi:hypothetical protein